MQAIMLKRAETFLNQFVLDVANDDVMFNIHYWGAVNPHYSNPLHKHSFFEVCYVVEGEGEYIDEGQVFPLRSGVLFCSRPEIWHQIKSEYGLHIWYVAFLIDEEHSSWHAKERYDKLAHSRDFYIVREEDDPTSYLWKALLLQAMNHQSNSATLRLIAHSLLCSFTQLFLPLDSETTIKMNISEKSKHLEKAKRFIQDNLSQPLAMEDVANYLHLSTRQLSRLFAKEISMTFIQYVHVERINRAIEYLRTSTLEIKEIAQLCGFQSVHYFTRLFTLHTGTPPAHYRRGIPKKSDKSKPYLYKSRSINSI